MVNEYTTITESEIETYHEKFLSTDKVSSKATREDPSLFAYYMLGFKPYDYQDKFLNDGGRFKIVCIGRQAGKTTMTAVDAIHKALYNKNYRVVVFSRNEAQSKKLIGMIREFIMMGDAHMKKVLKSGRANFFSEQIDSQRPNNTQQISFRNGSTLISLPATDGARGYTADHIILDEAAFMDEEIFEQVIEPMITHSGGSMTMLSTPNGQKGFFYSIFDPNKTGRHDEYSKYWFPSTICPEPTVQSFVEQKRVSADSLTFNQEYMALFTSSKSTYFKEDHIQKTLSEELEFQDSYAGPCFMGVDWGKKDDQSVISIVTKEDDYYKLIYMHAFPKNTNYKDVIDQVGELKKRFMVTKITADYGAGDAQINDMEDRGWHVEGFNFSLQSKLKIYSFLKRLMEREKFKMPNDKAMINEMRAFEYEITTHGNMKLHHPKGGHDDRLDSLVLALKNYDQQVAVGLYLV